MSTLQIQIVLSAVLVPIFFIGRRILNRLILSRANQSSFSHTRTANIKKIVSGLWLGVSLLSLGTIWNITIQGLAVYFASFFAVVGVAFFASWSVLSNVSAAIILFFSFPIRIGYRIRVQDGDNSIEGEIINISLFNIQIQKGRGETVFYPNNLAMQKPIIYLGVDGSTESKP
ncbi:MAG: mechanosensitive ion channel family protein [Cyanobacteria bacterium P01_G01_bin.4]